MFLGMPPYVSISPSKEQLVMLTSAIISPMNPEVTDKNDCGTSLPVNEHYYKEVLVLAKYWNPAKNTPMLLDSWKKSKFTEHF